MVCVVCANVILLCPVTDTVVVVCVFTPHTTCAVQRLWRERWHVWIIRFSKKVPRILGSCHFFLPWTLDNNRCCPKWTEVGRPVGICDKELERREREKEREREKIKYQTTIPISYVKWKSLSVCFGHRFFWTQIQMV